jgi:hypothetical protein
MSRGVPWRGFDYIEGRELTLTRDAWKAIIERASRTERIGGDLTLFDEKGSMTHEIYDKEKAAQ